MKIYFCFALLLIIAGNTFSQNVGVGTTTPHPRAALEIQSDNKGVLIPRIVDTNTVASPPEGLVIYNKNTRSPFYYNGNRWMALGGLSGSNSVPTERITYKVSSPGFSATELDVYSSQHSILKPAPTGGGGASQPDFGVYLLIKAMDINSVDFEKATIVGTSLPEVEIKFYATGSATPHTSYKLKNVSIVNYAGSAAGGGSEAVETLQLSFSWFGYRDWVNNKSFGYNLSTAVMGAY